MNPNWRETFEVIIPPVDRLEVVTLSKNILTADEIAGTAVIDLSSGTRLRRKLKDNQTHDISVDLEPQGRLYFRFTMDGEREDVDFWFRKTNERLIRVRDDFIRLCSGTLVPYIQDVISKSIKAQEAVTVPSKSFFSSLTSGAAELSTATASGTDINTVATEHDVEDALGPLIDYLDENLQTLCQSLAPNLSHQVIKGVWNETVLILEGSILPTLYGTIDPSRRILNPRQISWIRLLSDILADFFHADGEELGLDQDTIQTHEFKDLQKCISSYADPINRLMREYELSFLDGKEKEWLLRLIRMRITKQPENDKHQSWLDSCLTKRKGYARDSRQ